MAATKTFNGRLRRLTGMRPETGRVLSVYIDLDPSRFPTGRERASQITSLLDEAAKQIDRIAGELDHDELKALRGEPDRIRELLRPQRLGEGGALGVAVFACAPADLLELVKLPHPVQTRFEIGRAPFVDPLVREGEGERWCVALVNSRNARLLVGDEHGLEEVGAVADDVHGRHEQGGWSQRRYQESIEEERRDHLDHVVAELMTLLRRRPFDRLAIGAPEPVDSELEGRLHPYLAQRLSGRLQIDVENTSAADVLAAAAPVFEAQRREHERELLDRLRHGLARDGGRAAAGMDAVGEALEQGRVEVLLLARTSDGPDVTAAVERAIEQSAEVLVLHDAPDLGPHGGVAALLRW